LLYPSSGAWLRCRAARAGDAAAPRWAALAAAVAEPPLPWVEVEAGLSRRLWGQSMASLDDADCLLGMGHGGTPDGNPAHAGLAVDGGLLGALDLPLVRRCRRALLSACVLGQTEDASGEPLGFLSACFNHQATYATGWLTEVPDLAACLASLALQWALHRAGAEHAQVGWGEVGRATRRGLLRGEWPPGFAAWLEREWPVTAGPIDFGAPPAPLRRVLPWLVALGG
jgi:hypothetical protein